MHSKIFKLLTINYNTQFTTFLKKKNYENDFLTNNVPVVTEEAVEAKSPVVMAPMVKQLPKVHNQNPNIAMTLTNVNTGNPMTKGMCPVQKSNRRTH